MSKVFLRSLEIGDIEQTYKWHTDENLYKTMGGVFRFVSMGAEKEWLLNKEKYSNQEINLAICVVDYSLPIGIISVRDIDWISRSGHLMGVFIGDPKYRGQGYGTDALRLMVEHCFYDLGLNRIFGEVLETNLTSIKMMERCGFKVEGCLRQQAFKQGRHENLLVMGILSSEWKGRDQN